MLFNVKEKSFSSAEISRQNQCIIIVPEKCFMKVQKNSAHLSQRFCFNLLEINTLPRETCHIISMVPCFCLSVIHCAGKFMCTRVNISSIKFKILFFNTMYIGPKKLPKTCGLC